MVIDNQVMQLACAILPGLMSRHGQEGYTDSSANAHQQTNHFKTRKVKT